MRKTNSRINHWLNNEVVSVAEGEIVLKYIVRDDMLNLNGSLHGGIAATMIDELMGITLMSVGESVFHASAKLNIDFFRPAFVGEVLLAKSSIVFKGETLVCIEGELVNQKEKLVARGYGLLVPTKNPLNSDLIYPED